MANAASTIEIELEIRDAINRLGKLEGELKKSSSAMDRVANSTRKMESAFRSAKNAASALVAAISVQQIAQAADTFTNFANQIRIATNSAAEAAAVQKELYRVAQTTGTAIKDTTELYSLLRIAADQLGSSQAETIRITEIVTKSLAAAGKSSTEASGALLQLAQALNSPIVQAEEFNSLIDGMPNLLKQVEKQLGLTAGSLIKFVKEGNLSNQEFKDAILGSAEAINEQFGAAQDTIATSFTRLNNAFILLVGNFEKETGFFNSIASLISTLAENIDELARVLKAAAVGFAVAFAPKVIRAIYDTATAMKVLGAASKTNVIGALAALGFYIADVTGGLDLLIEKLGLTKDQADETSGAIVDLTKGGGGAGASQSKTYESAFFKETIKNLEGYLTDIEKYGPQLTEEINKILFDVNRLLDEDPEFVSQTIFGSDELLPIQQYITELSKIVEIVEAAIKAQRDYNQLKIKDAQITEEGAALDQKILDAKFAINKAQEELNRLQKIDIYDGILNALRRFLGIQEDITSETEKQLSNAEKQAKAREQYVNAVGDTVVTGVFGAGPNASRAAQMGQAYGAAGGGIPGLINASAAAALSNEKVAAAIEEQFTILFDTIDPLLDILADLQSAINRLVKALIEGITSGIEKGLDAVGLGPNGYLFGGGFARDMQGLRGFQQTPNYNPSSEISAQASQTLFEETIDPNQTPAELQGKVDELIQSSEQTNLGVVLSSYEEKLNTAIAELESSKSDVKVAVNLGYGNSVQEYMLTFEQFLEAEAKMNEAGYGFHQKAFDRIYNEFMKEFEKTDAAIEEIEEKAAQVIQGLIGSVVNQSVSQLDELTQSAQDQIEAIDFQNMSIQEQIEFRYQESVATIEQQKALAELIDDEDLRTQLLNAANKAEAKTIELKNKQLDQLEREQQLLALQNVETGLQALLSDFERTIEKINDLVQGLFDQVQELLFSDFSPLGPQEQFAQAQSTYESLLENAFDQEATEDDIKALQGFVNEYLTAARNVFKSSTAFTTIFEGVLGDLTGLGLQTGFNMPIQAASTLSSGAEDLLGDLPEELQTAVSDMISGLNLATLAFAQQQVEFLTTVYQIPLVIENDLLVVDTTNVNKPISLNASNFSIDSNSLSQIDLSILMSTSMFTVNTSGLNFGTITPIATAGTPYLGVVTPSVSLNTSSVTNSFNSLSSAINTEIGNLVSNARAMTNFFTLASSGSEFSAFSQYRTDRGTYSNQTRGELSGYSSSKSFADIAATYLAAGLPALPAYMMQYKNQYGGYEAIIFDTLSEAQATYNQIDGSDYFSEVTKYGFRQGGLVPDPLDTIPAMLSPGEYILSPETVRRYGVSNLNRLNSGDTAALNATSDPEVKRLLAELIVAVRENDTEVNVYTDMAGQTKASIEEFRSELRERTRRQGDKFLPARYI